MNNGDVYFPEPFSVLLDSFKVCHTISRFCPQKVSLIKNSRRKDEILCRKTKNQEKRWFQCLTLYNLMIAFGLLMASCTSPSSAGRQATRPPETIEVEINSGVTQTVIEVTHTPAPTPTTESAEETSLPFIEIDELMNELVNRAPLAGIALGIQYKMRHICRATGLPILQVGCRSPRKPCLGLRLLPKPSLRRPSCV